MKTSTELIVSFAALCVFVSVMGILYNRRLEKKYPQVKRNKWKAIADKNDPNIHHYITSEGILDEIHEND